MDEVRQGATILIMDRNKPVARLEPAAGGELASGDRVAVLVREGLAAAPRQRFGAAAFLARQRTHSSSPRPWSGRGRTP